MATPAERGTLSVVAEPTKTRLYLGDVVAAVSQRSGMPAVVVRLVIRKFFTEVSVQLAAGHEFVMPGVGTVFRHWIESPGPLRPRLQLRFRPAEKLRKTLQLYQ